MIQKFIGSVEAPKAFDISLETNLPRKIKLREGCRSDEYREALGCPVTDPEELWSLPAAAQTVTTTSEDSTR